ncbi:MAG: M15 family metallopeptidase [Paracoccaceae bacterium]
MRWALVLIAVAILTAPAGWFGAYYLLGRDTATRADLTEVTTALRDLTIDFNNLSQQVELLEQRGVGGGETITFSEAPVASDSLQDAFAQVVLIADRREVNQGMTAATPSYLTSLFGPPRADLNQDCQTMTNPVLAGMLRTEDVGPIRVQMLEPAIISMRQVFKNVEIFEPELYERIRSAGSLCVRLIRGSETSVSTHSFGLSLDLNIDGVTDTLGDDRTQLGLILLSEFFQREGWYWGAGFGREDSMHFEVSREKVEQWRRLGLLPDEATVAAIMSGAAPAPQ